MTDLINFDLTALAHSLIPWVMPHLKHLAGKAAEGASSESGKALVGLLKDKWLAKSDTARAAVADAAANPDDADNREAVEIQLRKALKADPEFAQKAARLASSAGIQIHVTGDNNKTVAVQGSHNTITID